MRKNNYNLLSYLFEDPFFSYFPIVTERFKSEFYDIKDGNYLLKVEVPGYEESELSLEIVDKVLMVKGLHQEDGKDFSIEKSFTIPVDADVEHILASYRAGILNISIPRRQSLTGSGKKVPILTAGN